MPYLGTMSTFLVEVKKITSVANHPNADRLEVVSLDGLAYRLVVSKGSFSVGGEILYFPLDAILPGDMPEELGVRPYLGGANHDVVRTAVLRGVASQGLPASMEVLTRRGIPHDSTPEFITKALGIVKYEAAPISALNALLHPLPGGRSVYDIENAERMEAAIEYIISNDIEVVVLEKMEGVHVGAFATPETAGIFQRSNTMVEDGGINPICDVVRKCGLLSLAETLMDGREVVVHAEGLGAGTGSDYYRIGGPLAPLFDIAFRGPDGWRYVGYDEFVKLSAGQQTAPLLFRGRLQDFFNGKTVAEVSHGPSALNPKRLREGIVIKPVVEQDLPLELLGGRLILKQRDPIYLSKN